MVERSGFREYYNPFTAEGFGSRDHSWSTLVVDMLDGPVEGRGERGAVALVVTRGATQRMAPRGFA